MAFCFAIPEGWKVVNTPTQVMLSSPDEKAVLVLHAEKTTKTLPGYIKKKAGQIEGSRFISADDLKVPGLNSVHQIYRVDQQEGGAISLRLSAIRKGDMVYTFSAVAGASDFPRHNQALRRSAQSFAPLRDQAFLSRRPRLLKLTEAYGRQTLQEIFSAAGMSKDIWPSVAILNGLELGAKPAQDSGRDDIVRRQAGSWASLLRAMANVRVEESAATGETRVYGRGGDNPTELVTDRCTMRMVVDGAVIPDGLPLQNLPPLPEVAGIEICQAIGAVPPQFSFAMPECGLIVVWTRDWSSP